MICAAHRTIRKFGGITACADALQYPKSTVQRWSDSRHIHPRHNDVILDAAARLRIRMDLSDFIDVDVTHPAFHPAPGEPSIQYQSAVPPDRDVVLSKDAQGGDLVRVESSDRLPPSDVVGVDARIPETTELN